MSKKQNQEIEAEGRLNEIIYIQTVRPNGSLRIQQDFKYCPTLTEQHSAHVTDLNYLIEKHKPDELAAYISAKNQRRMEIKGHDFSNEPDLQGAKNITYRLKKSFEQLPEEIKSNFKNHVEFLKFIDNPANQDKMKKLGLMTEKQIAANTTESADNKDAGRSEEAKKS